MKRLITITVIFLATLILPTVSNAEEGSTICVSKEAGAKVTSTSPFWPNGCPPVQGEEQGAMWGSGEQMKVVTPTESKMLNHLHFIENGEQTGFPNTPVIEIRGVNVVVRTDGLTANTGNLEVGNNGAKLGTAGATDNLIVADGYYFTTTVSGHGNLIAGLANNVESTDGSLVAGVGNHVENGSGAVVFGNENTLHKGSASSEILGGRFNCVNEDIFYATVIGGKENCATANYQIKP